MSNNHLKKPPTRHLRFLHPGWFYRTERSEVLCPIERSLLDESLFMSLMKTAFSRRNFIRSGALVAGTFAAASDFFALASGHSSPDEASPIRLGLASYTLRNFSRAQMIAFLKQLNVLALNCKDVKDHLPTDPAQEAAALADYAAAGIRLHAAGTIYFDKDEDADIRAKFEYVKRAGISVIVAGDPAPATLPRLEKFVKEYNIRIAIHNHGPEDKLWPSPLDVLKAVKNLDPRIGCCIDVGHTVRAGTDVVQAIREAGPRLHNIHMKDLTDFRDKDSQVAVGEGKMPVRQIFEALIAMNYQGFVDLEYEIHPDDPMPGIIASFAYMRGVLAGLGHTSRP
ncbi:MAG TPA: sugar phosphate isomerase/epimerase [Candidatus Angelobacter sp.]|nr:sugar phosphate isomerase/epimerase [Candidatus Angelobacter sp.]